MKRTITWIALGMMLSLKAQVNEYCGTNSSAQPADFSQGITQGPLIENPPECITYRLFFHFFRQDNGEFAPSDPTITSIQSYIADRINDLHSFYPTNIRFKSIGYDYIDNTNFYINPQYNPNYQASVILNQYSLDNDAIDLFFVNTIVKINPITNQTNISLGGDSGTIPSKRVVLNYYKVYNSPPLLAHELDHCLGLYHTNHGQNAALGGSPEIESQCETTGDYVCDTPLDEGLTYSPDDNNVTNYVNTNCQYTGPQSPPPPTNNIMSIFGGSFQNTYCPIIFTPGQIDKIFDPSNLQYLEDVYYERFDLAMRDNPEDYFGEPNWTTTVYDNSPDLWIRNNSYGNPDEHQNPTFNHPLWGDPSVKLRIKNDGCAPSTGNETVTVYWATPSTWQGWPDNWTGISNPDTKGTIGTLNIPALQPGQSTVLTMPWSYSNMPDLPSGASISSCLLAKIDGVDASDPLHSETYDIWIYNNNVVVRNLTVLNYQLIDENEPAETEYNGDITFFKGFLIENIQNNADHFDFDIITDQNLLNEAEVYYELPTELYTHIITNPVIGLTPHKTIESAVVVTQTNVTIPNFELQGHERLKVTPKINFLRTEVVHDNYTFRFSQRFHGNPNVLGSEHYEIRRSSRDLFTANSGSDVLILKGTDVNLLAEDIGENAQYNWCDCDGNLLYSGKNITLTAEESKALQLEVITDSDKYKDYDRTNIVVTEGIICSVSPNPTTSISEICTKLSEGVNTAVLMVYNMNHNVVSNYMISGEGESTIQIDLSTNPAGTYQIVLVINGIIADAQNLIKQ